MPKRGPYRKRVRKSATLEDVARVSGVPRSTIRYRMKEKGMTLREAVNLKRKSQSTT